MEGGIRQKKTQINKISIEQDDCIEEYNLTFLIGVSLSIVLCSVIYGYEMAIMNISSRHISLFLNWKYGNSLFLAIGNAVFCVGGLLGSLFIGKVNNALGRNKTLIYSNLLFLFSVAINSIPYIASFFLGRFLVGISCGSFSVIPPIFLSEISPSSIKSRLGITIQIALTFGIFSCFVTALTLERLTSDLSYYLILLLLPCSFSSLQIYILIQIYPFDSPLWLHHMQKQQESEQILKKIYKPCHWQLRMNSIENNQTKRQSFDTNPVQIVLTNPKVLSCILFIFQQFSGMYGFLYYSKVIFIANEYSGKESSLLTVFVGAVNFISVFPNFYLVTRVPRKVILAVGLLGMGLCNLVFYFSSWFVNEENSYYVEFFVFFMYVFFYQCGIGAVVWVYLTEILGVCWIGTAITVRWICACINVTVFPLVFMKYFEKDIKVYFVFSAGVCIVGALVVVKLATPIKSFFMFNEGSKSVLIKKKSKS